MANGAESGEFSRHPDKNQIMIYLDAKGGYVPLDVDPLWPETRIAEEIEKIFGTDNNGQPRKWVLSKEWDGRLQK